MTPASTITPGSDKDSALNKMEVDAQLAGIEDINGFMPYQLLMETEITLEYGKDLKKHRVIHRELLSCHSKYARDVFLKAKNLREAHASANDLRKQLKQYVHPHVEEDVFQQKKLENKPRL